MYEGLDLLGLCRSIQPQTHICFAAKASDTTAYFTMVTDTLRTRAGEGLVTLAEMKQYFEQRKKHLNFKLSPRDREDAHSDRSVALRQDNDSAKDLIGANRAAACWKPQNTLLIIASPLPLVLQTPSELSRCGIKYSGTAPLS